MTRGTSWPRDRRIALAVAELIAEKRGGGEVEVIRCPEDDDRVNPAVELETADAIGNLVIEHTRIEPFTCQIGEDYRIRPYAQALVRWLEGCLPVGSRFEINLDVGAVDGVRPAEAVVDAIGSWVVEVAPTLVDGRPGVDGAHMSRSEPPEAPIRMTLVRWPSSPDSPIPVLTVGRWLPADLEERRRARLVAALEAKLPKLADAAADGAERVLVIESADIALSNAVDITTALRHASESFVEVLPEWIVLWEQYASDADAVAWLLRSDATWEEHPRSVAVAGFPPAA